MPHRCLRLLVSDAGFFGAIVDWIIVLLWVPYRFVWPLLNWLCAADIVVQVFLALHRSKTPGLEVGWSLPLHFAAYVVLILIANHYTPRLLRPAPLVAV